MIILTYTVSTLAKLYSLDVDKVLSLAESEGIIVYDIKTLSQIGYLPTLAAYFKIDESMQETMKQNVKREWFNVDKKNDIITVSVKQPTIPVTSYLFSEMYDELDFVKSSSILLPSLTGKKLFIAEDMLIRRLSQGVAEDYTILPFIKGENNNELQ